MCYLYFLLKQKMYLNRDNIQIIPLRSLIGKHYAIQKERVFVCINVKVSLKKPFSDGVCFLQSREAQNFSYGRPKWKEYDGALRALVGHTLGTCFIHTDSFVIMCVLCITTTRFLDTSITYSYPFLSKFNLKSGNTLMSLVSVMVQDS